jgi:hypothetical protein
MQATTRTDARLALDPPRPAASPAWATTCLNCSSALSGPFCSECGQRAVPPHPSLAQLVGEAFAELSGWDGKIADTMRLLVLRPGKLTVEFLEGKRAQFISPVRLYLWCSVLYFLLAASAPHRNVDVAVTLSGKNGARENIAGAATNKNLTDAERKEIAAKVETAPGPLRPVIRRMMKDPAALQADVFSSIPKALFVLLPVFAGILAVFYRKRRYAEHLFYALHLHAFAFAALTLTALTKYTHSVLTSTIVGVVVLVLWLPFYTHRSLRRVYGGSFGATMIKEVGIGALYFAATIPALVLLAMWVAWRA